MQSPVQQLVTWIYLVSLVLMILFVMNQFVLGILVDAYCGIKKDFQDTVSFFDQVWRLNIVKVCPGA